MGDMGDIFNAAREAGKERRASNRETSPEVLRQHGVEFEAKNGGAHLVVKHAGKVADFWPGTGLYGVRGKRLSNKPHSSPYKRGVFNLLRDLGIQVERT
jgi:hypothetical protein